MQDMDEAAKQHLEQEGVAVSEAVKRLLGNMPMYERFLRRFPDDPNYGRLVEAVAGQDKKKTYSAAHTLKGICGNLSISHLQQLMTKQVALLYENRWEDAVAMMPEITAEYERICSVILKNLT